MLTKLYPMVQFKKDTWEIDEFDCASMFLLIGTEKERLPELKEILRKYCVTREKTAPSVEAFGRGLLNHSVEEKVTIGGAVIFTLSVDEFEKI